MTRLSSFLQEKINDCERVFENANTTSDMIFLEGMLKHGGETNALLMNIGKRQAYTEILDFIKNNGGIL